MRFYRHLRVVSNISALMVATLAIAPYGDLVARTRDRDACPGALQLHQAADGALARVRLPGGVISPAQLAALAHAATRFGSPAHGTHVARQHPDLRAITDTAAVAEIVAAAGLLPSQTHERVRNIVASPLSGRRRREQPTSAGWSPNWTRRSSPSRRWPNCRAGSCSASTTAAATSRDSRADAGAHFLSESTRRTAAGGARHRRAADARRRRARAGRRRDTVRCHHAERLGG